jgi:hypothetical protein
MTEILYLRAENSIGVIPLERIKGYTGVMVRWTQYRTEGHGRVEQYSVANNREPASGAPTVTLGLADGTEYPLAQWPGCVAVEIDDWLYWNEPEGFRPERMEISALPMIEDKLFPHGHSIPGQKEPRFYDDI